MRIGQREIVGQYSSKQTEERFSRPWTGRGEIVYESHLSAEAWRRYNRTSYMTRLRAWFCNSRAGHASWGVCG